MCCLNWGNHFTTNIKSSRCTFKILLCQLYHNKAQKTQLFTLNLEKNSSWHGERTLHSRLYMSLTFLSKGAHFDVDVLDIKQGAKKSSDPMIS